MEGRQSWPRSEEDQTRSVINALKVCFETFGCRLNRAEALQEEAQYIAAGWKRVDKPSEADLIILRGCSVTSRAQRDCEKRIDHLKRHYPLAKLVVCGCLPKKTRTTASPYQKSVSEHGEAVSTRTARAYLKVQDGCSGNCTFCIVPQFRGKSVSVDCDQVLDRARAFIDAGYHELVVTGCNLALYASKGNRLVELVDKLAALDANCRVRIGSVEPGKAARELVEAMAERPNICRFLHLPVQSGSNRILSAMRRPYLVQEVDKLVQLAIEKMPLIGLGCDLMTGFPGETDVDHIMTKGLLKRLKFSNAHIFPYSGRPNTIAVGLPSQVDKETRRKRAHELSKIAAEQRRQDARKFIGHDVEMLVEDEENRIGWTGEYFQCKVTTTRHEDLIRRKDIVKVHVMDAHAGVLQGVIV